MARVISTSDDDLKVAAAQLQSGGLVAFPTETVYGLGARLHDPALAQIFAAKHRPYSDPIICHFDTAAHAKQYVTLTATESSVFDVIASKFWPGPLTIVCVATSAVPPLVMAGTGCVGVRVPSHVVCHRLLELCGEPIAAPSANLFAHVSPTTVGHVETDLGSTEGLLIIDGGSATIGIESTVIKLKDDKVCILRPGFVTSGDLRSVLGIQFESFASEKEKQASPGQETKHYAPNVKTVLARVGGSKCEILPTNAVIVDFNRRFASISGRALRYLDLSPTGSVSEAISRVYELLREVESVVGVDICVICDVIEEEIADEHERELVGSLRDRLLRSASHMVVEYRLSE